MINALLAMRVKQQPLWLRTLLIHSGFILAGAMAPLALSPYQWWPAATLSLLLLILGLENVSTRQAFWRGWSYGLGFFGMGVSWVYVSIHEYGNASVPLAVLLTFVFVAGLALLLSASFAWCYVRLVQPGRWSGLLGFPALWVLFEWLRSWLLTGFPWLYAGYSYTETALAGWAPLVGVYGLSLFAAVSAGALAHVIATYRAGNSALRGPVSPLLLWLLLLPLVPWILAIPLNQITWLQTLPQPLRVTLVQPNVTQDIKWLPEQRPKTLNLLKQQAQAHGASDLILWPENAVPLFHHRAQPFLSGIDAWARNTQTAVITGLPYADFGKNPSRPTIHNSIVAIGAASGVYHKQKLVPFGEYLPLENLLRGLIAFFDLPMSNFRPGPDNQPPIQLNLAGRQINIAPAICYEIVYPDFTRRIAADSNLLLTISDDSWFGASIGPHQHLQMAQMRALENAKPVIRATNTGITAIIDAKGNIIARAPQFVVANLTAEIELSQGTTPFSRLGSWPILALCCLLLASTALGRQTSSTTKPGS